MPVRANIDIYLNPELRFIVWKEVDTCYKNLLITNKVAGFIFNKSRGLREIILAPRRSIDARNPYKRVPYISLAYMPLAYILFFLQGKLG